MFNVLIDINYNHFLHLGSSQICVGDILAFSFRYCVLFLVPMDLKSWFLKVFHSPYHTPSNIAHKPSLPVEVPRPQVPRFCRHLLVELWGNVVIVINLAVVSQTPEV